MSWANVPTPTPPACARSGRTPGFLVPALTDLVLANIYDSIERTADQRGHDTFVANTQDDMEQQRRRVDLLLDRRVDGLLGDARLDSAFVDELAGRGVPFVLTSRRHDSHPSVTCDELGGRLAAEHLLGLGHRRVAVVAGESYARALARTAPAASWTSVVSAAWGSRRHGYCTAASTWQEGVTQPRCCSPTARGRQRSSR